MRMYFDNCALGRLFDEQSQELVRNETEAVKRILGEVDDGMHQWIVSEMLRFEINRNPDHSVRTRTLSRLKSATAIHPLTPAILRHASQSQTSGIALADAIHLHVALAATCDVLLTTDIRFIRRASALPDIPARFVRNPVDL